MPYIEYGSVSMYTSHDDHVTDNPSWVYTVVHVEGGGTNASPDNHVLGDR